MSDTFYQDPRRTPVSRNSEILFVYHAKLCNPNGDPEGENRPRIDPLTWRNYVTDVRLKRFFRDYVINSLDDGEGYIWVTKIKGQNVTAEERLEEFRKFFRDIEAILSRFIDVRLFGVLIPIEEKGGRGKRTKTGSKQEQQEGEGAQAETSEDDAKQQEQPKTITITGPVQFNVGFSLHRVDLADEVGTITSIFRAAVKKGVGEEERRYGTIGRDPRVHYSLIAFYGAVSARRAKRSKLVESDLMLLDNCLWEAVMMESVSRSKIGHYPHLYLRIEYNDDRTMLGDLRRFIDEYFEQGGVRDLINLRDKVRFDRLVEALQKNKEKINRVYVRTSEEFEEHFKVRLPGGGGETVGFTEALKRVLGEDRVVELPHKGVTLSPEFLDLDAAGR